MVRSAGLVLVRRPSETTVAEVLLVHPGGPYFMKKDDGFWSIPKGIVEDGEDPLAAAIREVHEEIGLLLDRDRTFVPLGEVAQKGGKRVMAWASHAEFDPAALVSQHFEIEWPPRSGKRASFPEVDRVAWLSATDAARKILSAQQPLLDRALAPDTLTSIFARV